MRGVSSGVRGGLTFVDFIYFYLLSVCVMLTSADTVQADHEETDSERVYKH